MTLLVREMVEARELVRAKALELAVELVLVLVRELLGLGAEELVPVREVEALVREVLEQAFRVL